MKMEIIYRREDIVNLVIADFKKRFGRDIIPVTVQTTMAMYDKADTNKIVSFSPKDIIEHYTVVADELIERE